jgi:hypothetical protein
MTEQLDQTRVAIAALAGATAKALGDSIPGFGPKFEDALSAAYRHLKDSGVDHVGAMETLSWAREFYRQK